MSPKVGVRSISTQQDYESLSNATKTLIDEEIRAITDAAYQRAEAILAKYKAEHLRLAEALMKYETLDAEDVDAVVKGKPIVKNWSSGGKKTAPAEEDGGDESGERSPAGHVL